MQKLHPQKTTLFTVLLTVFANLVAFADFNPVPLTPESFNADVVVEKEATPPFNIHVTATMDGGTNNNSWVWYEQGFDLSRPTTGLPPAGTTFAAVADANRLYQMPSDYAAANVLCVYTAIPTGKLTLTTPAAFSQISILNAGGGGGSTIDYVVHHQGGADEVGTITINDWFNTTAFEVAWNANGRVNTDNGQLGNTYNTTPNLFYSDIYLADTVNPVTSIEFTSSSGNRAVIFGVSGSTDGFTFNPVAVTGFNHDMVIEAGVVPTGCLFTKSTVVMDGGSTNNIGNTWYEVGFNVAAPTTGVPKQGTSITNGSPAHVFTMAPDYTANNVIYLGNYAGYTEGSFTLTSPTAFSGLSFLNSAGNGPVSIDVTVHHVDTTTEFFTFNSLDWFNSATPFYAANGRFDPNNMALNNVNSGNPRMFANDIVLANTTSPVTKIDFAYVSGGRAVIFAVAGQTTGGGDFNPVAVTGYNADAIVEAAGVPRYPGSLYTATSISMDGGTNNTGNTWMEKGYYPLMPMSGLPSPGEIISSVTLPDHHYQMPASYTANNAIFVDSTFTNANLTLVNPESYTALSFLSSCANGRVTNQCIMEFADGTTETNTFVSQDWFNNTPYAFSSLGRVNLDTRIINNDPGRTGTPNPRLYEAQLALNNTTSPLTNVVLKFLGSQNANGRMVVLAVSGTKDIVQPIIASIAPQTLLTIEGSNVVVSASVTGGTPPVEFRWQTSVPGSGVWTDLVDGGNISGAATTNLTFTSIGWTNTGDYRLVATNAGGFGISPIASITVRSGLPDVTVPGDPIAILNGSTPAAEAANSAINNTIQKYLNFDADSAAPFVGPVGLEITPSLGSTIVSALRIYTANDATERDPVDYTLEGSDDGATWTLISTGPLSLPGTRNTVAADPINPLAHALYEVHFDNTVGYTKYRLTFNNVKDNSSANSMQIAEVELLGIQNPIPPQITRHPIPTVTVYAGASPTFGITAGGVEPLSYQWYVNNTTPIPGATEATYTLTNAQLTDSGKTFHCRVTNIYGVANSFSAALTVIAAPTQPYPSIILADNPVGYWRLGEPEVGGGNNGVFANDYWGGHVGVYSNTINGSPGYNPTADPDTAALFGVLTTSGSHVADIHDLSFGAPTNTTVNFSVEAWVNAVGQSVDAGIVTKGGGGGSEQFCLDTGGSNPNHAFRFFIRDAGGQTHAAIGTKPLDGKWHHVVGVCDQSNGRVVLYVDGLEVASGTTSPWNGLLETFSPISIGARQSAAGGPFNNQLTGGYIDEVAIYNYALSSNQVMNHYFAAQPAPVVLVNPTNTTGNEGGSAEFHVVAYGPGTLNYQWYDVTLGDPGVPLAGATSPTLVLNNLTVAQNLTQYRVTVTSEYGSVTAPDPMELPAQLTVLSGPPVILTDLPSSVVAYAGRTVTLSVTAGGTTPLNYQWQVNGINVSNNDRISGAQTDTLTIVNAQPDDSANYQVLISNSQGGPVASSVAALTVQTVPTFNTTGAGWGLNGNPSPATISGGVLQLTTGAGSTARSAFYQHPLYVGAFVATFTYQDAGGGGADGATFVLHNDPRGTTALGGGGGAMGYSGITPSVAIEFNIYDSATLDPGLGIGFNGAAPAGPYASTAPVNLAGGNPIDVTLVYVSGVAQLTLRDTVSAAIFTTNLIVGDITEILGAETAYVGFTGADGGTASTQRISNFEFVPYPLLTAATVSDDAVSLSWPASIGGYALESSDSVTSPVWTPVTATVNQVDGQNQVVVTPEDTRVYRLKMLKP